jgi:hypothetical protein
MACQIENGLTTDCSDLLRVGGLGRTFWVTYKSMLDTQISLDQVADVSSLDFGSYGGFQRFDGNKFSHSFTTETQRATGGNVSFKQSFTAKVLSNSTADDVVLQDLALGEDIIVFVEDNNQNFYILGAGNGLSLETGTQTSGETGDSDNRDTITLSGQEKTRPIRFALATYQQTLDYIESFEL